MSQIPVRVKRGNSAWQSDFDRFKERLNPSTPTRFPPNWEELKKIWQNRDYALGIIPGSFYGFTLRDWIGLENLSLLFYDDPRFVHEMIEHIEYLCLEVMKKVYTIIYTYDKLKRKIG